MSDTILIRAGLTSTRFGDCVSIKGLDDHDSECHRFGAPVYLMLTREQVDKLYKQLRDKDMGC